MLVLFVLVIVLLNKRMEATIIELEDIKKVERFVQSVGHARYSDAYSDIKGSKKTGISSKKN